MAGRRVGALLRQMCQLLEGRQAAPDSELLERFARHGDDAAFAALMRRHGPLVFGVCRRVLRHEQDAEDVFQATFLVLARKAATVCKRGSVGSWLYGVAYRLALKAGAAAARRRRHEQRAAHPPAPDPETDVTWRELRGILDEELARLPDRYRAPLLLCYLEGQTQDEAARQLGWKPRTVKSRLARGRSLLRRRLTGRGLAFSAALAGPLLAPGAGSAMKLATLTEATARAAKSFAAGQTVAGVVSGQAAVLAEGGLRAMFLSKLQVATAALLTTALVAGGAGLLLSQANSKAPAERGQPAPETKEAVRTDLHGDPLPAGAVARLGTVRFRTGGFGMQGLAFLPDGKTLITAEGQGYAIQFWDAATGRLLREFSTRPLSIRGFALSPDGKRIAVGGFLPQEGNRPTPGAVRVLAMSSGKEVQTFARGDRDMGHCVLAFTPDGKLLLSIGDSGVLRIEEVTSGVEILRQQFPRDIGAELALSPDGSTLAVSSGPNSRKLYVWQWQAGEEPRALKVGEFVARWLCFSPDGKLLAATSDRDAGIRIWDVGSGRLRDRLEAPDKETLRYGGPVFAPDGKILAATSYNRNSVGAIHLWEPAIGKYRRRLGGGSTLLAISPDSRRIAAGVSAVQVWDLVSGKEVAANDEAHRGRVDQIAVSARGLAVTASGDHTVRLWDAATGKQRLKLQHGYWVRAVALSPDGGKVASSSLDNTVRLWDARTGREIYRLAGHGEFGGRRALGFTSDGKRLLSWGDDFYLRVWDVGTGKAMLEHALRPRGVRVPGEDAGPQERRMFELLLSAFSADGKVFVLATGQVVHVFDVETGKEIRTVGTETRLYALAVSPDGTRLLAGGLGKSIQTKLTDGRVRFSTAEEHPLDLWDLRSGKRVRQVILPGSISGPVAFSADGKTYAAAMDKPTGEIRLWETTTGKERPALSGFRSRVSALAFSADGRYLISGMDDTTALVWDLTAKH